MPTTYYGPGALTLEDGTTVQPGEAVTLDEKTQAALEKAGLRFSAPEAAAAPAKAPAKPAASEAAPSS